MWPALPPSPSQSRAPGWSYPNPMSARTRKGCAAAPSAALPALARPYCCSTPFGTWIALIPYALSSGLGHSGDQCATQCQLSDAVTAECLNDIFPAEQQRSHCLSDTLSLSVCHPVSCSLNTLTLRVSEPMGGKGSMCTVLMNTVLRRVEIHGGG